MNDISITLILPVVRCIEQVRNKIAGGYALFMPVSVNLEKVR